MQRQVLFIGLGFDATDTLQTGVQTDRKHAVLASRVR